MTVYPNVRQQLDMEIIPRLFLNEPVAFLNNCLSFREAYLQKVYAEHFARVGETVPCTEDFSSCLYTYPNGVTVLMLLLPAPPPELFSCCTEFYLTWREVGEEYRDFRFYAVERGFPDNQIIFLDDDETHVIQGCASRAPGDTMDFVHSFASKPRPGCEPKEEGIPFGDLKDFFKEPEVFMHYDTGWGEIHDGDERVYFRADPIPPAVKSPHSQVQQLEKYQALIGAHAHELRALQDPYLLTTQESRAMTGAISRLWSALGRLYTTLSALEHTTTRCRMLVRLRTDAEAAHTDRNLFTAQQDTAVFMEHLLWFSRKLQDGLGKRFLRNPEEWDDSEISPCNGYRISQLDIPYTAAQQELRACLPFFNEAINATPRNKMRDTWLLLEDQQLRVIDFVEVLSRHSFTVQRLQEES